MKYVRYACLSIIGWLMMGCSQQVAPTLPPTSQIGNHNISDRVEVGGETVKPETIGEGATGGSSGQDEVIDDDTPYNSSADGFKSIYFAFDSYEVDEQMQKRIVHNAQRALTLGASKIKIEGNCDEFGTDEYNYALGLRRAQSVKEHLVANGVDANKLYVVSFGESNPICNEPTDVCYARNRRVDLRMAK